MGKSGYCPLFEDNSWISQELESGHEFGGGKGRQKKEITMNKAHERILTEYLRELHLQNRPTQKVKSNLKIFLKYAENSGIDFLRLKIRDAQDFQMYLSTAVNEDGSTCAERSRSIHYSRGSVLAIIGSTTSFYDYLRKKKVIISNPFLEITRIKRTKPLPKNILNEENMDKFLRHLKEFRKGKDLIERRNLYKAHVVSELMYSTGARINEIMKLRSSDVDFIRGVVRITDSKTGVIRDAILNEYAGKVLLLYVTKMREYVLFGKNNADMSLLFGNRANLKTWLNGILNRESGKLKLGKFTSHYFRHAVGYHLLRGGCDIRYIQEILGHKEMHTTQVYTKVDKEDLKNVIDEFHPRTLVGSRPESLKQRHHEERSDELISSSIETSSPRSPLAAARDDKAFDASVLSEAEA